MTAVSKEPTHLPMICCKCKKKGHYGKGVLQTTVGAQGN